VEFVDGAMLAQLCPPSMTFPIQHALLYPQRTPGVDAPLDLNRLLALEFRPVDEARFPLLRLAKQTMVTGGGAPAIFNAANEVAVAAFLAGRLPFLDIHRLVDLALQACDPRDPASLDEVLAVDAEARRVATKLLHSSF
jgi:1-deoxy-D-xylulose-5-phosphate reductoisomerase